VAQAAATLCGTVAPIKWIVNSRKLAQADAVSPRLEYSPVARRRGGKLTPKGRQTRARIVEAAAELMLEQGVAETTIEHVRDAAEVSSSQVYHYFADKQALVLAVIDYQSDTIVGGQQPLFDQLDTLEGLRSWRDFLVEHQRRLGGRGGCPLGSLGVELAEIDDAARIRVAASFARWEAGIRSGLRAMHTEGRLAPDADPDALAVALLAALQGGLLLTQLNRDTRPLEQSLDAVLSLVESLTSRLEQRPDRLPAHGSVASDGSTPRSSGGEVPRDRARDDGR
jgi:TetR/AcrR family transcriptional repressor of nem operon